MGSQHNTEDDANSFPEPVFTYMIYHYDNKQQIG